MPDNTCQSCCRSRFALGLPAQNCNRGNSKHKIYPIQRNKPSGHICIYELHHNEHVYRSRDEDTQVECHRQADGCRGEFHSRILTRLLKKKEPPGTGGLPGGLGVGPASLGIAPRWPTRGGSLVMGGRFSERPARGCPLAAAHAVAAAHALVARAVANGDLAADIAGRAVAHVLAHGGREGRDVFLGDGHRRLVPVNT